MSAFLEDAALVEKSEYASVMDQRGKKSTRGFLFVKKGQEVTYFQGMSIVLLGSRNLTPW